MSTDPVPELLHVLHGDIVPYAKRGCRTCDGKGEFTAIVGGARRAKVCGCALKRFMLTRGEDVELVRSGPQKGALIWKRKAPEPATIPGTWKAGPGGVEIGERVDGSKHVHVHIKSKSEGTP